jgi:hypothetical protein
MPVGGEIETVTTAIGSTAMTARHLQGHHNVGGLLTQVDPISSEHKE